MFKYLAYIFMNKILGHFYLPFLKKKKDLQGFVSWFFGNKVYTGIWCDSSGILPFSFICLATEYIFLQV